MNSTNSNCSAGHDATIVSFFEKNGEMCLSEAIDGGLRTVRGSKDRKLLGKVLRRLVADGFLTRRTEVRLCRGGYGYPQHLIVYRALTTQERRVSKREVELASQRDELLAALEEARRAIGEHLAPNDCYATGPMTGDEFRDLVQCPACSAIAEYERVIAKVKGGAA
ncbi:hypothetical protein [Aeromonas caviae]|uniref:hypothetical protein n=1 Tax=Aeromonas caviae TaxID=648 RepID=UPI00398D4ED8